MIFFVTRLSNVKLKVKQFHLKKWSHNNQSFLRRTIATTVNFTHITFTFECNSPVYCWYISAVYFWQVNVKLKENSFQEIRWKFHLEWFESIFFFFKIIKVSIDFVLDANCSDWISICYFIFVFGWGECMNLIEFQWIRFHLINCIVICDSI